MQTKNYIHGQWVDCLGGETFSVINPYTEESLARVPAGGPEDVDRAVQAAKDAWPAWRRLGSVPMRNLLREVAVKSRAHQKSLAEWITREAGKPLVESLDEIEWIASVFEYYSELGRDQRGRVVAPVAERSMSIVVKEPYGVVGCIAPWNYPLLLMAWKAAPALAAGNTVVIKPSSETPLSLLAWVEAACDHLPNGVINVVTGSGGRVGVPLVEHPDVRAIAITGSVATGLRVAELAAKQLKKTSLELGGNDPTIVCDDVDIEIAAQGTVWGGFVNAGQVCTSVERVYVFDNVAEPFIEAVVEAAKSLRLGDPMASQTDLGPLVSKAQREMVEGKVERARKEGARLLTGGRRPSQFEKGYFYEPTVFDGVESGMELMREEIFGPILSIQRVGGIEEAIRLANDSRYALGCSIYTNNMEWAMMAAEDIKAGSFWVNDPLTDNEAAPFGGMRLSGGGRELGIEGIDEFREPKHILMDYKIRRKDYWFPYDLEKGRKT